MISLVIGFLLINAYVLACLGIWIWHRSKDVQLASFSDLVVGGLEYTLITQLGATFAVPVVVWLLVTLPPRRIFTFAVSVPKEGEEKKGAGTVLSFHAEKSAHQFTETLGDRQSESLSTISLAPDERIEDAWQFFREDACSGISNVKDDAR